MRGGAFDGLVKPFADNQIDVVLKKAEEFPRILRVNQFLTKDGGTAGFELLERSAPQTETGGEIQEADCAVGKSARCSPARHRAQDDVSNLRIPPRSFSECFLLPVMALKVGRPSSSCDLLSTTVPL